MAGLPKRRAVPNVDVCDEARGLDPDSAAPPSHREFPLHEAPHILLPYLRCASDTGASPADGTDDSGAAPAGGGCLPGEEPPLPARDIYSVRRLHAELDRPAPAGLSSAERAYAVCPLPKDVHEMLSMPTREVPGDPAGAPSGSGRGSSTKNLLEGFADARAPVPRALIDEISAEEAEGAEANWDVFAGNCLAVCPGGGEPRLLCASGLGLDSLCLLRPDAHGLQALGAHPLPAGRRVRQVSCVQLGDDWLGVARASYWLHFVRITAGGALSCAGVSRLRSLPTHATLNPRVGGEAAAVLEDGHLVTMRLERNVLQAAPALLPSAERWRWGDARVARLPWQADASRPPLRWSAAEWGEHPRLLYVANPAQLYRVDLRAPRGSLLLDLHEAPWRPRDPLSALATPRPGGTYGCDVGGGGALVALASSHSLLLLDTRCVRAPQQQWTLPPSPAPWPQPRHWLSFSGRCVELFEKGTGRVLAFVTAGRPPHTEGPLSLCHLVEPPPLPRSLDPARRLFRVLAADEARTGRVLPLAGGARVSAAGQPAELVAVGRDGSVYHLGPRPEAQPSAANEPVADSGDAKRPSEEYPLEPARASAVRAMLSCGLCRGEAERKVKGGYVLGHTCGLAPTERRAHRMLKPRQPEPRADAPDGGSGRVPDDYFSGVLRPTADEVKALLGRATEALARAEAAPAPADPQAPGAPDHPAAGAAPSAADAPEVEASVSRLSRLWDEWSSSQVREGRATQDATASQAGAGTSLDVLLGPGRSITPARAPQPPPKHRKRRSSSGF